MFDDLRAKAAERGLAHLIALRHKRMYETNLLPRLWQTFPSRHTYAVQETSACVEVGRGVLSVFTARDGEVVFVAGIVADAQVHAPSNL